MTIPEPRDTYAEIPFAATLSARRSAYLEHLRQTPPPDHPTKLIFYVIGRLAASACAPDGAIAELAAHRDHIHAALDFIDARHDCADFVLHGVLRLLYQFHSYPGLDTELQEAMRQTVLGFKYWPDEPGQDSMCTWTENHQILFSAAAYLAGQRYPTATFTNSGVTGRQLMAQHRTRIMRWLDIRFRTGFSEWLSHVYYDEDLTALLSLVDFADDAELQQRATMIVDLLLFEIVLNSFRGVFGSTHGRSYADTKRWAAREGTTDTTKLLFGMGIFATDDNMSAVPFLLSRYRVPQVLDTLARNSRKPPFRNRQRMGLKVTDGHRWGISYDSAEDGMVWLSMEAYFHPKTINLTLDMFDTFNWWANDFFHPVRRYRQLLRYLRRLHLLPALAHALQWDLGRNTREEVNILTYRTANYMLSTAQDYRPGYGGDQQHVWQATLGPDAVSFTTHPVHQSSNTPDRWAGSGVLPRVAQIDNVVIAIYNIHRRPALYVSDRQPYTHAWLPQNAFDEIREQDGWIFARKGEGYLALRSRRPYHWLTTSEGPTPLDHPQEVVAPGRTNVWICELGCRADNGPFEAFVATIANAALTFRPTGVDYTSPSQGRLTFGWTGSLHQDGREIPLHDYPRYDNPYAQAPFPMEAITIRLEHDELRLDWHTATRTANAYLECGQTPFP